MNLIDQINDNDYYIIHYAGSDIQRDPFRIASITVFNAKTKQSETFARTQYNEKQLLKKFFDHLQPIDKPIITWNMKDSTYGIQHIMTRYENYYKETVNINVNLFIDLDKVLQEKFETKNYVPHKKLTNLAKLNNLHLDGYREGEEEVELYEFKNYRAIEISCNRKARIIHDLFELYRKNSLKVEKQEHSSYFIKFLHSYQQKRKISLSLFFLNIIIGIGAVSADVLPYEIQNLIDNTLRWLLFVVAILFVLFILLMEGLLVLKHIK